MNLERITDRAHPHYAPAWTLYQAAFPANERRDEAWQAQALAQVEYHMCAAQEGGGLIAIAFYWAHGGELFLEHLAVLPELRGRGIGAAVLREIRELPGKLILEIEKPVDAAKQRRQRFYEREGLTLAPFGYDAPSYQAGKTDCPLQLMSEGTLTETEFTAHCAFLQRTVLRCTAGGSTPLKPWTD